MAYTTLAAVKERLGVTDTTQDGNIQAAIDAAERIIDGYCRRSFAVADSTATQRWFTADGPVAVTIDDAVEVTSVAVDRDGDGVYEETIAVYRPWPYDAPSRGRPYTRVETFAGTYLPLGPGAVRVTARWGWPAVPAAVSMAAELQAWVLLRQATTILAGVDEAALEALATNDRRFASRYLDRQAQLLLDPYRRVVLR